MSASAAASSARCAAELSQDSCRFLTTFAGAPTAIEKSGTTPRTTACEPSTQPRPIAVPRKMVTLVAPQVADPDRGLDDALILDRNVDVVHAMIEIADVTPVGHQHRITDLDVEVAVDDV